MTKALETRLRKREQQGNLRKLQLPPTACDFSSNDYLGLATSLELRLKVFEECQKGLLIGSTGSRLLTGNSLYAEVLEEKIASFHGYEAGLLFSCGYLANVGVLTAVTDEHSVIFYDAAIHASTHEGIRLSRAKAFGFRHNDLNHLEERLKACSGHGDRLICIESIYSTDGSMAPLTEMSQLAKKYAAELIVDEAHAVGVCGPQGRGLVAAHRLMDQVFAQVTTFGKALGTYGAIVLGTHRLKEALINFATSCIYTTALPFPILAAIRASYDLFPQMDQKREHLQRLIDHYRSLFPSSSRTHLQSIPLKGNDAVVKQSKRLIDQGFDLRPLMSPTVRKGHESLRVCLHAFNTERELSQLLLCIES